MLTKLNYEGFEKYLVEESDIYFGPNSYLYEFKFENKYRATVMKHSGTLGGSEDLFELITSYKRNVVNNSPAGTGTKGFLTNEQVLEMLEKIKEI